MFVRHHDFHRSIVSNRNPDFLSSFCLKMFALNGQKLSMSSVYHPQIDSQSELVKRTLEQYLRAFTQKPSYWVSLLPWTEFHYNTSFHSGLKM
jgi:hypothetical protein